MDNLDYEFIQFKNFDNIGKDIEEFVDLDEDSYITIDHIDNTKQIDDLLDNNNDLMERMIYINHKYFYNDVKNSYRDDYNIYEQFSMDFNRNRFYLNNNLVEHIKDIDNYLEYKFSKEKVLQIMMLSTQAIMGLPFQILQNSVFQKKNIHVSELPATTELYNGFGIKINIVDDNIMFCARKYLRIFKLSRKRNDQTKYIIKIKLDFELDNNKDVVMKIGMSKVCD
jgi:hypothetical protein